VAIQRSLLSTERSITAALAPLVLQTTVSPSKPILHRAVALERIELVLGAQGGQRVILHAGQDVEGQVLHLRASAG
jgi:hypothetical protein